MRIRIGSKSLEVILICLFGIAALFAGVRADAQENEDAITAVAWNYDGTSIAVGCLNGRIEVVTTGGQTRQVLQEATGKRVNELVWHPGGNLLASGSDHGNIQIWDTSTGGYIEYSAGNPLECSGLLWSYDGNQLWAIALEDRPNLFVWITGTGELISSASVGPLFNPKWNEEGTFLVAGSLGTVPALISTGDNIMSEGLGEPDFPIKIGEQVFVAVWSSDGNLIAGGTPNGHVRVWNADTSQLIMDVGGDENYDVSMWRLSLIVELAFTPDGKKVQALDGSGVFRVWDVATSELLMEEPLPVTGLPIYAAEFSPDGTRLAYGGEDGMLEIVDLGPYFSNELESGREN